MHWWSPFGIDILTVSPESIQDIPILQTMIDGKFVYTNPNQDPNQEVKYWVPGRGFVRMDVAGKSRD